MFLKDKIEINNGFFKSLKDSDSSKYQELFGDYDESLDAYFYFLYGYRTASSVAIQNTLTNVGHILWVRYYSKWKKLYYSLSAEISANVTYKHNTKETYTGTGANDTKINDITKKFGFDSDEGKNDTSTDTTNTSTNTNQYSRVFEETNTDVKSLIDNQVKSINLISDYEFLQLIIYDILKIVSQQLYNEDDE